MEIVQNLLIQSNSSSLIEWRNNVKQHVTGLNELFYENGRFTQTVSNTFNESSSLIVFAEQFLGEQLMGLLSLLDKEGTQTVRLYSPELIENTIVIRLALSNQNIELKERLVQFCQQQAIDFALMPQFPDWSQPGLVLMDMDSTTIQIECIDEIARLYGVGEQVSAVTALAMQGKLDFNQSLRTRVGKLKDAPVSILQDVADNMPLMPGLLALIKNLKKSGWKVAIASGGFNYFADRLKQYHGFDAAVSNSLEIKDGMLTGEVTGEIVNADVKKRTLSELAEQFDIPMSQTVAIGDGANDLLMLSASGMGIAIHAKPIVQEKAEISINHTDLQGALCILSAAHQDNSWA